MTFHRISMTNAHNLFNIIVICMSNKKRRVFYIQTGGFDKNKDAKQVVY